MKSYSPRCYRCDMFKKDCICGMTKLEFIAAAAVVVACVIFAVNLMAGA